MYGKVGGDIIRYYLETVVFPETTAHQATKLSANGQDLGGSMLFGTRIGFSGTPSSLLPLEMGECVYQKVRARQTTQPSHFMRSAPSHHTSTLTWGLLALPTLSNRATTAA